MTHKNKSDWICKQVAVITLLSVSVSVCAEAIYLPSVYKASFGDGLKIDKYKSGYYTEYENLDNFAGFEFSNNHFHWNDWAGAGEQYNYITKQRDSSGTTKNLSIGYNSLNTSNSLWTADANYGKRLTDHTTAEVAFNRDRVEVQQSLVMNVFANNYSASIEEQIIDSARVQLTYGETRYTDGNHRPLVKLKATYDVLPEQGINFQVRSRYFRNTDTTVNSGYFNPYHFVEHIAAVEINQTLAGWTLSGNVGYGRQAGGDDPKTLAKAFEFSATAPVAPGVYLRAKAGYFRSLGYNGPDFIYRYVSEDVVVQF